MKRLTREEGNKRREEIRRYFAEGHTAREVAEKFDTSKNYIKQICKGIRTGNQYTNGLFDREANAINCINNHAPNFEYAGNFTGMDGTIDLRCKTCGTVTTRSMITVRHNKAICRECERIRIEEKARQKETEARIKEAEARAFEEERKRTKWQQMKCEQVLMKECPCCGMVFIPNTSNQKYCSTICAKRVIYAVNKDKRIRKIKSVVVDKDINLKRLYRRDNGICHICGGVCDWLDCYETESGAFVAGESYPSIDHVKPLSKGGVHAWYNVKLAHRHCNTLKSDLLIPPTSKKMAQAH